MNVRLYALFVFRMVDTILTSDALPLTNETNNEFNTDLTKVSVCANEYEWACPGTLKCVLKNDCSSYEECALLNCDVAPPPSNVKVVDITFNTAFITWDKDSHAVEYKISCDSKNFGTTHYTTSEGSLTLSELQQNTEYFLTIYSVNKAGMSKPLQLNLKTKRIDPPSSVNNMLITEHTVANSIQFMIKWDPPIEEKDSPSNRMLKYHIEHCIFNESVSALCATALTLNTTFFVNYLLQPSMSVTFSVTSLNELGQSGPTTVKFYRPKTNDSASDAVRKYHLSFAISVFCFITIWKQFSQFLSL